MIFEPVMPVSLSPTAALLFWNAQVGQHYDFAGALPGRHTPRVAVGAVGVLLAVTSRWGGEPCGRGRTAVGPRRASCLRLRRGGRCWLCGRGRIATSGSHEIGLGRLANVICCAGGRYDACDGPGTDIDQTGRRPIAGSFEIGRSGAAAGNGWAWAWLLSGRTGVRNRLYSAGHDGVRGLAGCRWCCYGLVWCVFSETRGCAGRASR